MEVRIKIPEPEIDKELELLGASLMDYLHANARYDDPRTAAEIMRALQIGTDSKVQAAVHSLRGHRWVPVGSRCVQPFGYFIARNRDELAETDRNLYNRAMSTLFALCGIRKAFPDAIQGELEL